VASVLIRVGFDENKTSSTCDTTAATISASQEHHPDTPESMASRGSSPEEIPHASTLALPDLEALLAQQEERSKEALGNALAKKQKAERLHERTRAKEGEAQTFRVDYEQAESAIQELRKLIVEKNKEALEKQFETKGLVRTAAKRPRVSSAAEMKHHSTR